MVSLTLAMALAVRLIGAFFVVSAGLTSGVVVVAIGISLKGLVYYYSKARCRRSFKVCPTKVLKLVPDNGG
jgi:hypothetical protein